MGFSFKAGVLNELKPDLELRFLLGPIHLKIKEKKVLGWPITIIVNIHQIHTIHHKLTYI